MFSVPLTFIPPFAPDIVQLNIYESPVSTSGFVLIDSTTEVGVSPTYINRYVTQKANYPNDWFSISWLDSEGYGSQLSTPIQGGSRSLVGEVVERVIARDRSFNYIEMAEEAEYVISYCFDTTLPYSVSVSTVDLMMLAGLAKLTLCKLLYTRAVRTMSLGGSYSAGMISQSAPSSVALDSIERMWRQTLAQMGIGGSRIADISHHHGHSFNELRSIQEIDVSRLLSTREERVTRVMMEDMPSGFVISRRHEH